MTPHASAAGVLKGVGRDRSRYRSGGVAEVDRVGGGVLEQVVLVRRQRRVGVAGQLCLAIDARVRTLTTRYAESYEQEASSPAPLTRTKQSNCSAAFHRSVISTNIPIPP